MRYFVVPLLLLLTFTSPGQIKPLDLKEISKKAKLWFRKYGQLVKTILSTGDGKEPGSAYIVTSTSDEYTVLDFLELKFTQQAFIEHKKKWYDLMSVRENESGIDKVYFDINLFFGKMK